MSRKKLPKLRFVGTLIKFTKYTCVIEFSGSEIPKVNKYKDVNQTKLVKFTARKFPIKYNNVKESDVVEIICLKKFKNNKLSIVPKELIFIKNYQTKVVKRRLT